LFRLSHDYTFIPHHDGWISMTQNLYVAGAEQGSGKSVIVLALMEAMSGRSGKVGFFRPVIRSADRRDELVHLISERYQLAMPYTAMYGCTGEEARELLVEDRYDEILKRVLEKYRGLQSECDQVLCAGTDYTGGHAALEFDFNADVANNLGCFITPVVRGNGRESRDIVNATTGFLYALEERHCDVLSAVINGVAPSKLQVLKALLPSGSISGTPVCVVPEAASLLQPTMGDVSKGLGAQPLYGDAEQLSRQVEHYKIAAMQVPDFLDHVEADSLVITPGDRSDIILACLTSYPSTGYPQIAGLLLTGGLQPAPQIGQLIEGLGKPPFAILSTDGDTFSTAMAVNGVAAVLTPENERKVATALGTVETNMDLAAILKALKAQKSTRVTPLMFEYELLHRASERPQRIVLPEGPDERILRAAEILALRGVAELTLLGDPAQIGQAIDALRLQLDNVRIIDPQRSELREEYAERYFELRKHKGVSMDMARDTIADVSYFGTMMVQLGHADGMVSGAVHTTQHTIRPAFEIIKTRPDTALVSSVFLMCLEDRVLIYGDCAVNPDPDAEQLAEIAISSADTARVFGIEPRVAMLSYSTGESGKGEAVEKVREATRIAGQRRPDLVVEGPIQYDAAVDAGVAKTKLPDSDVAGNATVFIFPDLNTGNSTYKAVQRSAGAVAIGPVLQGLNKPVNDLSRGCTVTDIVNTVAITAVQAQCVGSGP
jgi:phosphate acetyltransferase